MQPAFAEVKLTPMKNYIILIAVFLSFSLQSQTIESVIKAKPFEISGSLGGNFGLYKAVGVSQRTSPFQYGLSARLNFKIYSFSIPVYASIRDNSFNYGSSFSRIRINPQYKWVKLHIGDAYINFNPYTLAGRTIKGYGVELTPGKFRLKFIKGKIEDLRSYRDTLELGTVFDPTYSRKTTALGIGFGTAANYIDLYGVTTADRLDSLNGERALTEFTRKSNTVLGSTFALQVAKGLSLRSNFGISLQTDNLDSYGDNTIIGGNTLTNNLAEANISSSYSYGGDVALNYSNRLFSINGKVKYVQPYFEPLTVAFVNTDIINYTIGGSTSFFRRKINIAGSVGIQRNNLSGNKLATSNNFITNIVANFRIVKGLTGTVNYSNFVQDYEARLVQINDLYTYAVNNNVSTASLRYSFPLGGNQYSASVRGGKNSFLTIDNSEEEVGAYDSWNSALNVSMSNKNSKFKVSTGVTYRTYQRETSESTNYGLRANASKGLIDNKIKISINTAFSFNDRDGLREGNTWRNGASLSYKLNDKSNIGARLNHIQRVSTIRADFNEYRMGVQYLYRF